MSETPEDLPRQDDPRASVTDEEIEQAMAVDSLPEQVERSAEGAGSDQVQLSDGSLVDEADLAGDLDDTEDTEDTGDTDRS